jgi:hypothetical protein
MTEGDVEMYYEVAMENEVFTENLTKSIVRLIGWQVPQAEHFHESGLYLDMWGLAEGELLVLETQNKKLVTVTKVATVNVLH